MSNAWALPPEVFAYLRRLPPHATVVELGSGEGTETLVRMMIDGEVHSVEHDEKWIGRVEGTHYIYAPIVDGWYAEGPLVAELPQPEKIDCLIVDGPPGDIGRAGLLGHMSLFGDCAVVVDDVHRRAEFGLAASIAERRGAPMSVHHLRSGRAFATIGWGDL